MKLIRLNFSIHWNIDRSVFWFRDIIRERNLYFKIYILSLLPNLLKFTIISFILSFNICIFFSINPKLLTKIKNLFLLHWLIDSSKLPIRKYRFTPLLLRLTRSIHLHSLPPPYFHHVQAMEALQLISALNRFYNRFTSDMRTATTR